MALTCRAVGGIPLLMIRVTVREGKETALTVMWSLGRSGETQRLYEKGRPKNVAGKLRWAKENVISTSDCQPLDGCPSRIPIENYWTIWIPVQTIAFSIVPQHLRISFIAAVSFCG